ncbi:MAG TPA: response regulator [Sediminispirochaeta sp.]|nr:response regulator [Sediminispirochaeta sp.]
MGPRVLVVDDIAMLRNALREALEEGGMRVIAEAGNGREAVLLYEAHKPDVVLLDITMPVMDGLEALRRIKKRDPRARVVMCSAMNGQRYLVRAVQLGARDFIVKPFKKSRIISAVRKAAEEV